MFLIVKYPSQLSEQDCNLDYILFVSVIYTYSGDFLALCVCLLFKLLIVG